MSRIAALGYIVVRGPVEEWCEFATQVLGAQLVPGDDSSVARFRTDEKAWRIRVEEGPGGPDCLVALGYSVDDDESFDELVASLRERSIDVTEDADLARDRQVQRLASFGTPDGITVEAHVGHQANQAAFVSPRGVRFVTGDLGLGHTFFFAEDGRRSARWFQDVLGFRLSDTIAVGEENGYFLRCNPRHHTVAFAAVPGPPPGLGHLMVEVDSLESVGRALDIVQRSTYPVLITLGEHSNDRMTSFYVATPSGFTIEYGWNGLLVDDATWKVGHYDSTSLWGHEFRPVAAASEAPAG